MKKIYLLVLVLLIGCSSDSIDSSDETPVIIETGLKELATTKGKFI